MHEGLARERSAGQTRSRRSTNRAGARPERWALWALLLALFSLIVAAANAHAATGGATPPGGGASPPGGGGSPTPTAVPFGTRVLRLGMVGSDVRVLNGIVKSKSYGGGVPLNRVFESPTLGAVQQFQASAGLNANGIVNPSTSRALVRSLPLANASWYGPGFYGQQTACGQILRQDTVGVANRRLPCGTKVTFAYHGLYVIAPVIDRGPYVAGYSFDLTNGARQALGLDSSVRLRYAVAR